MCDVFSTYPISGLCLHSTTNSFLSSSIFRVFYNNYPAPGPDQPALVTPSTDGQSIPLPGINDYAGQILKDERAEFDSSGVLKTIRVCTNVQV